MATPPVRDAVAATTAAKSVDTATNHPRIKKKATARTINAAVQMYRFAADIV